VCVHECVNDWKPHNYERVCVSMCVCVCREIERKRESDIVRVCV